MTEPHVTFLLLSYRRPANMQRQLDDIAAAPIPNKSVILSNNNPAINIFDYVAPDGPAVTILQQSRRRISAQRYELAREAGSQYFVALDDDLFLSPDQIAALAKKLFEAPTMPHGIWGQKLIAEADGRPGLSWDVVRRVDCQVDVLNRAYAFTNQHVTRFFELLGVLGLANVDELGPADDILISVSGAGRPWCHDLGAIENCPTSNTPGIAFWKDDAFYPWRLDILSRLRAIGSLPWQQS